MANSTKEELRHSMSFRIDPLGAGTPRPLGVKPIPSRRQRRSDEREERRQGWREDEGATYAPAPEPVADAYGPRAPGARRAAPPTQPYEGEPTPPWVAALLRAR